MPKTMTFEEAFWNNFVHMGDYFVTTMPKDRRFTVVSEETGWHEEQKFRISAGEQKLWRLEEGLKLWGEPTKEELILRGSNGFSQGIYKMHDIIRNLYTMAGIFEDVNACRLSQNDYFLLDMKQTLQEGEKKHHHLDDAQMHYWLASRRTHVNKNDINFLVFVVSGIFFGNYWLGNNQGEEATRSSSIRPEAILKPTALLELDGNGSKERPWRCLAK